MSQNIILVAIFVAVLLIAFTILSMVNRAIQLRRNIDAAQQGGAAPDLTDEQINDMLGSENENVRHYFEVQKNDRPDSMRMRMIRAGFFNPRALFYFNIVRLVVAVVVFLSVRFLVRTAFSSAGEVQVLILAALVSALSFLVCVMFLERLGKGRQIAYRKLFPDFMDLLIVCVDAGLSIEAALDRVTREFLVTDPDFGTHLSIVAIEVRAGRTLHQALFNFAERINLEEVRSLAILFRQSVELGASVSKTLRVFSNEMRQQRIIKAEEKANSLPIKMLFPLGFFLFPVNLVIVLVPILIAIIKMFMTLTPGG